MGEEHILQKSVGIRGIGVICPLGVGFQEVSGALIDGVSGAARPDASGRWAARVDRDPSEWHDTPKTYLDRSSSLVLAAASLARREAGWDREESTPGKIRSGISVGTAYGCPDSMLKFWESVVQKGPRLANSIFFTHSYPNTPASIEAIEHSLSGAHYTFCQGMASGALAVAAAMDALRRGQADRMMAGGFEALNPNSQSSVTIHPIHNPQSAIPSSSLFFTESRPIQGEGAVILALESYKPGEPYLAALEGAGSASFLPPLTRSNEDGRMQWGLPSREAVREAVAASMRQALADAGENASGVDLVVLSACGRQVIDLAEAEAISQVFGNDREVPCTTIQARMGCAPGASSLYSLLAAVIALREEWIIEVGCPVGPEVQELLLAEEPMEKPVTLAVVNSIDERGTCVSLVVKGK